MSAHRDREGRVRAGRGVALPAPPPFALPPAPRPVAWWLNVAPGIGEVAALARTASQPIGALGHEGDALALLSSTIGRDEVTDNGDGTYTHTIRVGGAA